MTILDRVTAGPAMSAGVAETLDRLDEAEVEAVRAELHATVDELELMRENLVDLQMSIEDRGWDPVGADMQRELPRSSLGRMSQLARTMSIANPLIRRGLNLRIAYVWGAGVVIGAKATGETDGEQDVNVVVQAFLDDPATRQVLTSTAARERNERSLGTDGNLFVALPTAVRTGAVQPRIVPFGQVQLVVKNPDDATDVWFYQRRVTNAVGDDVVVYHPDVRFRPRSRVKRIDDSVTTIDVTGLRLTADHGLPAGNVMWDTPVVHVKVNDLPEWDFGIGDAFSALAWARAYKEFLEDWSKMIKALSRFTWRLTGNTSRATQAAMTRIRATPSTDTTPARAIAEGDNPRPVGQVYGNTGATLEAIPKTGATIDADSGRPLAAMVAAGLDVPVTMLLSDPGVTGARATADTLDTPTENMANLRRGTWTDALFRPVLDYVIDQAVKAPQGPLRGQVSRDEWGREVVTLDGDTTRTLLIDWPDLTQTPVDVMMKAIASADGLEKLPPLLIVRLAMAALGVSDTDEWLTEVTDPETGGFIAPDVNVGDVATRTFRQGGDPAEGLS